MEIDRPAGVTQGLVPALLREDMMPETTYDEQILDFIEDFQLYLKVRDRDDRRPNRRPRRPRTIDSYCRQVGRFVKWLVAEEKPTTVDSLIPKLLDTYFISIQWMSPSAQRNAWVALDLFFRCLIRDGTIETSPLRVACPVVPKRTIEQATPVVAPDDQNKILDTCRGNTFNLIRDNAVIRLFLDSGIRCFESLALEVEDLNFEANQFAVRDGKGGFARHPAFTPTTGRALRRYLRVRAQHKAVVSGEYSADSGPLWFGQRGPVGSTATLYDIVDRRAKQAGVSHVHPHMLRHTWADECLSSGQMSEGELMSLGGWQSPVMIHEIYGAARKQDRAVEAYKRAGIGSHRR